MSGPDGSKQGATALPARRCDEAQCVWRDTRGRYALVGCDMADQSLLRERLLAGGFDPMLPTLCVAEYASA